jgi:histidinol-phosphate aminotransferase
MRNISELVRPSILNLQPYSSARDEWSGEEGIFLDANENPIGTLNRYPDPFQKAFKSSLQDLKNVNSQSIFIGNGSDEVIDLLIRIFCEPIQDQIIICPPTYGMYEVSASINNVGVVKIPLDARFQLQTNLILAQKVKMIFLCSPNNPTGNRLENLDLILAHFDGIVVVDEAYIDFSEEDSCLKKLADFPNLVVMQTMSKAWGLAAARIGMAFAHPDIIALLNKVKPPYNVSALNQIVALQALERISNFEMQKQIIIDARNQMVESLKSLSCVRKVHPSEANFLLVEVSNADLIYKYLVRKGIIVRNRHSVVNQCLRITIGTPEENEILIDALKDFKNEI